jgi:hypothetical protein
MTAQARRQRVQADEHGTEGTRLGDAFFLPLRQEQRFFGLSGQFRFGVVGDGEHASAAATVFAHGMNGLARAARAADSDQHRFGVALS